MWGICWNCNQTSFILKNVGKCNRGLMVIGSLRHLVKEKEKVIMGNVPLEHTSTGTRHLFPSPQRDLTAKEESNAIILGWCIEWVGTYS